VRSARTPHAGSRAALLWDWFHAPVEPRFGPSRPVALCFKDGRRSDPVPSERARSSAPDIDPINSFAVRDDGRGLHPTHSTFVILLRLRLCTERSAGVCQRAIDGAVASSPGRTVSLPLGASPQVKTPGLSGTGYGGVISSAFNAPGSCPAFLVARQSVNGAAIRRLRTPPSPWR